MRMGYGSSLLATVVTAALGNSAFGNVLVFGTGWGQPNAVMTDMVTDKYSDTNLIELNVGVSKFHPEWGTLNSVEAEASFNYSYSFFPQGPGGEWNVSAGVGVGASYPNGLGGGDLLNWEEFPGSSISGNDEGGISVSDVVGNGVVDIPVWSRLYLYAENDVTFTGMFSGIATIKYTYTPTPPTSPNGPGPGYYPGDTDGSGTAVNQADVTNQTRMTPALDNNGDGVVNFADLTYLYETILDTRAGDLDLDGDVDLTDLDVLESNMNLPGTYVDGDIDGDGVVTFDDWVIWDSHFGYERGVT